MSENQAPSASYKLTLKADSGYKGEQSGRISVDQYSAVCGILGGKVAPEVVLNADAQKSQIDWLQKVNTLHRQVDILYVVDGYEVTVTWDDNPVSEGFHGETVAEAISKAMAGFDLEKFTRVDGDIYGHERQMAALVAQRDELLAALETIAGITDAEDPESYRSDDREGCLDSVHDTSRAAIAKAKGGAA